MFLFYLNFCLIVMIYDYIWKKEKKKKLFFKSVGNVEM